MMELFTSEFSVDVVETEYEIGEEEVRECGLNRAISACSARCRCNAARTGLAAKLVHSSSDFTSSTTCFYHRNLNW